MVAEDTAPVTKNGGLNETDSSPGLQATLLAVKVSEAATI